MAPLAQRMKNPHGSLLFASGKSIQREGKHTKKAMCVAMVMRSARANLKKAKSDSEAAGESETEDSGSMERKEKLLLKCDDMSAGCGA